MTPVIIVSVSQCCSRLFMLINIPPLSKSGGILFYLGLSHEYFRRISLRNYITWISEILFRGLYESVIPCDAFSDSSLNKFLFTEHLYQLAHDSQVEIFVKFSRGTTIQGCLKFGFRVYKSQLYHMILFSISSLNNFLIYRNIPAGLSSVSSSLQLRLYG